MNRVQNRLIAIGTGALILASLAYMGREAAYYTTGGSVGAGKGAPCVVIDAGQVGSRLRKQVFSSMRSWLLPLLTQPSPLPGGIIIVAQGTGLRPLEAFICFFVLTVDQCQISLAFPGFRAFLAPTMPAPGRFFHLLYPSGSLHIFAAEQIQFKHAITAVSSTARR